MSALDAPRILLIAATSLGLGAALANWPASLPLRPGVIGAALLIGAALWMRRHWAQRRVQVGDDPSAAERRLWLCLVGSGVIVGFVACVLLTPGSEVHRATGDTGGLDSWLMLGGAAVAWWLLAEPDDARDERDREIAAYGDRVGYWTLVLLLMAFLLALGFAPPEQMQRFTHWLIANTLLNLIMVAGLVQYVAQLARYARERRLDDAATRE